MAGTYTEKLHLYKPVVADNVSLLTDFNNNWDELDTRLGNLYGLTEAEATQLKKIGDVEVSYAQWGALGALVEWTNWTPTLTGDADLSGFTHARYFRIGDICFFEFSAEVKNVTTAGNTILITLPFTHANTGIVPCYVALYDGVAWVAGVMVHIPPNVNYINLYKTTDAGAWTGTETGVKIRMAGFFEIA